VLRGLAYGSDGSLQDDIGYTWRRVPDWLEPAEAERLIQQWRPLRYPALPHAPDRRSH